MPFDDDEQRRLPGGRGTGERAINLPPAVLWLIGHARTLGLPHVYLGYWVPESRKMAYKARFRPAEVLSGGTWRMLTDADVVRHDGAGSSEQELVQESTT